MFKEAVIGILAAVAKQERVRLSERTIAGLQRARAQGRVGGRPRTEHDPRTMANLTGDGAWLIAGEDNDLTLGAEVLAVIGENSQGVRVSQWTIFVFARRATARRASRENR